MFKKINMVIVLSILALIFSMLAWGAFSSSQTAPVDNSGHTGTDSTSIVPCSQLIPPDELKNLLINLTPTLTENSYPGGTSCVWSYTNSAGQSSTLSLQVDFSPNAVSLWESKRQSEQTNEPSDLVVNGIDGLADESNVWSSKTTGLYAVYARNGGKTLIMRYVPQDALYMANESGIIDMVDRFFNRF